MDQLERRTLARSLASFASDVLRSANVREQFREAEKRVIADRAIKYALKKKLRAFDGGIFNLNY